MAVAWTDITNAQVAAGAAVDTALMTALRDNPEGIAQRAPGAPKIFGVPYDFQEFSSSGTWTKPSNAEIGDVVFVLVVGGGENGTVNVTSSGGAGGAGVLFQFDIDYLGATEPVVVGAGAAGVTGTAKTAGGSSSFGTDNSISYIEALGGDSPAPSSPIRRFSTTFDLGTAAGVSVTGSGPAQENESSIYGGGGGGAGGNGAGTSKVPGGSHYAGDGGWGVADETRDFGTAAVAAEIDGKFPGGGGGGLASGYGGISTSGAGADGCVRVWCLKRG